MCLILSQKSFLPGHSHVSQSIPRVIRAFQSFQGHSLDPKDIPYHPRTPLTFSNPSFFFCITFPVVPTPRNTPHRVESPSGSSPFHTPIPAIAAAEIVQMNMFTRAEEVFPSLASNPLMAYSKVNNHLLIHPTGVAHIACRVSLNTFAATTDSPLLELGWAR